MTDLTAILRSGAWLTRERVRLIAGGLAIASLAGLIFLIVTADGLNDRLHRPLGTDFSNVYAAGTYVLDGEPAKPFDPPAQHAREQAIFGAATPFYGWHYPPFFLALAALLATMPYLLALAVWQGATLAAYLWMVSAILSSPSPAGGESRAEGTRDGVSERAPPPPATPSPSGLRLATSLLQGEVKKNNLWLLLALAFPAVFINLGHGHNGFLTAALFGGALLLLDRRPILAGVLFGLLVYKPQFGVLIPLALIASGRWRTVMSAAITVVAMTIATTWAFGIDIWSAFLASGRFTRTVVLEAGDTGWHKIQSVFAWARMWGAPVPLAYAVQAVAALGAAVAVFRVWRSTAAFADKAAVLLLGTLLATPYSLDYDLMLLAPALAFLAADVARRGAEPWEASLLAALWLMPVVARSLAQLTLIPLAVPIMLTTLLFVLRRTHRGPQSLAAAHRPA